MIQYGGGLTKKLSSQLQKAGNFAAKSMIGMKRRDSATEALLKLNMMPLANKRDVHLGVQVHKLHNQIGPKQLTDDYSGLTKRRHQYNTRNSARGDMSVIPHNTSRFEKSTIYRAISNWNSIPEHIRNIESTSSFKRTYQAHLLARFKTDACT